MLLLVIWPALTSHALLQQVGLIHQAHEHHHHGGGSHEHNSDHHVFADGDYIGLSPGKILFKPSLISLPASATPVVASVLSIQRRVDSPGRPPPANTPALLQRIWHFSLRTALPARAPSLFV